MPWRDTKDPYPVWLSEIILQQTRVDQGLPYWRSFIETFPTVTELAMAQEEKVLRLWQGLGYYSRARNLHATAKHIYRELNGQFPTTYDRLIKLKGIGPYTAAAISSICFDEPRPVVDGNVFRFASRYFGIKKDISLSGTRKLFEEQLTKQIDTKQPGSFNQAMMEFGATVCLPSPNCSECIFKTSCYAFEKNLQDRLPVKTKKVKTKERFFNYIVIKNGSDYFMKLRGQKDVWTGLYDFLLIEGIYEDEEILNLVRKEIKCDFVVDSISTPVVHILSHQRIKATFYSINVDKKYTQSVVQKTKLQAYSIEEVLNLPKPKLIVNYLNQIGIN